MALTVNDIQPFLLLKCIAGSRAYGLNTATSDTDIKGVFYLPEQDFYGLNYVPQVNNETNDEAYYELGRFVELLLSSNPAALELLNAPQDTILFRHPLMDLLSPAWFLSKACINTFAHYGMGQIKKARGLNKKIVNPMAEELKTILDFCSILCDAQTKPLLIWLSEKGWRQEQVGLAKINHARNLYALYYDETKVLGYQGVSRSPTATDVALSHIEKSATLRGHLSFNKEGYSTYRKNYQDYWKWVKERNEQRYLQNLEHGCQYDSKNMMHTFRLLLMAQEIATTGEIHVKRHDRDTLLAIKAGQFSYEERVEKAEALLESIEIAFRQSTLPEEVNKTAALNALISMRKQIYSS